MDGAFLEVDTGDNLIGHSLRDPHRNVWECKVCGQFCTAHGIASPDYHEPSSNVQLAWMRTHSLHWRAPAHDPISEGLRELFGIPRLSDIIYAATLPSFGRNLYLEDGTPIVAGINIPTREQMAAAEARMQNPCLKCGVNHRPWERCAPHDSQESAAMAKDKSKKKDKKVKKEKVTEEVEETTTEAPTSPSMSVEDLDNLINALDTASHGLKQIRIGLDDDAVSTPESAAEEGGKKSKKDKKKAKGESAEVVTYTEKELKKIADADDGRDQLVAICTAAGISEDELKGKQRPTLIKLILGKQAEAQSSGASDDEFKADSADNSDDPDFNEDTPPEKKKSKKDKKKAKKSKK